MLGAAVVAAGLILSACGANNAVGSGVNLHGSGGGGNLSLGSTTSTTAAAGNQATTTSVAASAATTAPPTTVTRTTAPAPAAYVIHINGDTSGQPAFGPTNVAVYQGTTVEWINSDSKPHSVVATDGAFSSPTIPPGGSWSWVANTVGRHDYADGTRPYATGALEVASR